MNPLQKNVNVLIHMINNAIKTQDSSLIMKIDDAVLYCLEDVGTIINNHQIDDNQEVE